MTKRDIGQENLDGIQEIKAFKKGAGSPKHVLSTSPAPPQIIRSKLNVSQATSAGMMGVSLKTIQESEQGRRKPSGPALAL